LPGANRQRSSRGQAAAGWLQYGDKYLDGLEIAEHMKIEIKHLVPRIRAVKIAEDWKTFV
jgi:hypothetical protein